MCTPSEPYNVTQSHICDGETRDTSSILLKIIEGPMLSIITLMHFV